MGRVKKEGKVLIDQFKHLLEDKSLILQSNVVASISNLLFTLIDHIQKSLQNQREHKNTEVKQIVKSKNLKFPLRHKLGGIALPLNQNQISTFIGLQKKPLQKIDKSTSTQAQPKQPFKRQRTQLQQIQDNQYQKRYFQLKEYLQHIQIQKSIVKMKAPSQVIFMLKSFTASMDTVVQGNRRFVDHNYRNLKNFKNVGSPEEVFNQIRINSNKVKDSMVLKFQAIKKSVLDILKLRNNNRFQNLRNQKSVQPQLPLKSKISLSRNMTQVNLQNNRGVIKSMSKKLTKHLKPIKKYRISTEQQNKDKSQLTNFYDKNMHSQEFQQLKDVSKFQLQDIFIDFQNDIQLSDLKYQIKMLLLKKVSKNFNEFGLNIEPAQFPRNMQNEKMNYVFRKKKRNNYQRSKTSLLKTQKQILQKSINDKYQTQIHDLNRLILQTQHQFKKDMDYLLQQNKILLQKQQQAQITKLNKLCIHNNQVSSMIQIPNKKQSSIEQIAIQTNTQIPMERQKVQEKNQCLEGRKNQYYEVRRVDDSEEIIDSLSKDSNYQGKKQQKRQQIRQLQEQIQSLKKQRDQIEVQLLKTYNKEFKTFQFKNQRKRKRPSIQQQMISLPKSSIHSASLNKGHINSQQSSQKLDNATSLISLDSQQKLKQKHGDTTDLLQLQKQKRKQQYIRLKERQQKLKQKIQLKEIQQNMKREKKKLEKNMDNNKFANGIYIKSLQEKVQDFRSMIQKYKTQNTKLKQQITQHKAYLSQLQSKVNIPIETNNQQKVKPIPTFNITLIQDTVIKPIKKELVHCFTQLDNVVCKNVYTFIDQELFIDKSIQCSTVVQTQQTQLQKIFRIHSLQGKLTRNRKFNQRGSGKQQPQKLFYQNHKIRTSSNNQQADIQNIQQYLIRNSTNLKISQQPPYQTLQDLIQIPRNQIYTTILVQQETQTQDILVLNYLIDRLKRIVQVPLGYGREIAEQYVRAFQVSIRQIQKERLIVIKKLSIENPILLQFFSDRKQHQTKPTLQKTSQIKHPNPNSIQNIQNLIKQIQSVQKHNNKMNDYQKNVLASMCNSMNNPLQKKQIMNILNIDQKTQIEEITRKFKLLIKKHQKCGSACKHLRKFYQRATRKSHIQKQLYKTKVTNIDKPIFI